MRSTNLVSTLKTSLFAMGHSAVAGRQMRAYAVCGILCAMLSYALPAVAVPVAPGVPVSGYLFDEGSGTSTADAFGSNNGTLVAMEPGDWVATTPFSYAGNGALNFDGGNEGSASQRDRVNLGQPANLNFDPNSNSFTISAWFQVDAQGTIVSKAQNTTGNRQYQAFILATQVAGAQVGGVESSGGSAVSTGNNWHHYALVSTPTSARIYIDGNVTPVTTFDPGTSINPLNIYIGARHGTDAAFDATTGFEFDGRVDEVGFWNSALSTDNIEWLAANSLQNLIPIPAPEPSSILLLGLGTLGLVRIARRRNGGKV